MSPPPHESAHLTWASNHPGEYVEELGQSGSIEAETVGILMEHNVATRPFNAEVRRRARAGFIVGFCPPPRPPPRPPHRRCSLARQPLQETASLPKVAPGTVWQIPADELAKRRDLREERIFSIDPPTAKCVDMHAACARPPPPIAIALPPFLT